MDAENTVIVSVATEVKGSRVTLFEQEMSKADVRRMFRVAHGIAGRSRKILRRLQLRKFLASTCLSRASLGDTIIAAMRSLSRLCMRSKQSKKFSVSLLKNYDRPCVLKISLNWLPKVIGSL